MEHIDDAARSAFIRTALDTLPGAFEVYPGHIQFSLPARYSDGRTAPPVPLAYSITRNQWTSTLTAAVLTGTGAVLSSTLDAVESAPSLLTREAVQVFNARRTGRTIVGEFIND